MFGFSAFAALPFAAISSVIIPPPIIIEIDTHDGGKRKKEEEEYRRQEAAKAKTRRDEVLKLFERIVEGKPELAEEIAQPFVIAKATIQAPAVINYDAMLASFDKVEQIYNAYLEMDDEDVLLLI